MTAMTHTERLRVRLLGRPLGVTRRERVLGWLLPLAVAAVGGFLRFWHLGQPHQLVFDETYYVKEAYSMLKVGYELRVPDSIKTPDAMFTANTPDVFGTAPDLVVHPPVGKWVIAVGEHLFGVTSSFGWRFSVAVLGTLSILMIGRVGRRLFRSTVLGTVAAILLCFEGVHFVHSRTGILDLIVMFWAFAGFAALLLDRDRSREILARRMGRTYDEADAASQAPDAATARALRYGPWLGWRPWRWVAAVCLGLATGTKWSGVFFLAAFTVMSVLWDMGARRAAGVRSWWRGALTRDGVYGAAVLVLVAVGTYLASWVGWFRSTGAYDRSWAATHPSKHFAFVPDALRSLAQYHREVYHFHVTLDSPHQYQSNPWSWLVIGRPTSFFYEGPKKGQGGCTVAQCSKAIATMGTPTIWWGGTVAIAVLLFLWALRRDWRAGAILAGIAAGYLPWFHYQQRTIFTFYEVAFVPWMVLAVTFVLGLVIGRPAAAPVRRAVGWTLASGFVLASVGLFAYFWPIYTAQVIPYPQWLARMWLPSWI